jgi:threonine synthase
VAGSLAMGKGRVDVRYVSTRDGSPPAGFDDLLLSGLAPDGGLYVPETWPHLTRTDLDGLAGCDYADVVCRVLAPFLAGSASAGAFPDIVRDAYDTFDHAAVAPLRQLSARHWLLELFHGPTLAFKDFALQCLGRLFEDALQRTGDSVTVVGATSGDTGSAAIEACRDRKRMTAFVLHPAGRVSEIQRRQMTTVDAPNIFNIAIDGTFDDCQAMVKAMFNDHAFARSHRLVAVNSINWARVMIQAAYYVYAALALGGPARKVRFVVPTGNFGDVYAGYVAHRMGLPVDRLVVATNRNDILARFFATGRYQKDIVHATISPSMDIQVSSNFERLLFEGAGRDGRTVRAYMKDLDSRGGFAVAPEVALAMRPLFSAQSVTEAETLEAMGNTWSRTRVLVDPHTAVGLAAARRESDGSVPIVTLATAHPAKFPDAVRRATGEEALLPPRLADLAKRAERFDTLPNDLGAVSSYIAARASRAADYQGSRS